MEFIHGEDLGRLIASGHPRPALKLALELMKQGSRQVEASDEGLMTYHIEDCLREIPTALMKSDLPPAEIVAWCTTMLENDRVGFIATRPLQALREHFQTGNGRG